MTGSATGAALASLDALNVLRIEEDMERLDDAMLYMGYVEPGGRHWAVGRSGGPLQTSDAIVPERRADRREDETSWQMAQKLGHGLGDAFVAVYRSIGLVQDGVGGV